MNDFTMDLTFPVPAPKLYEAVASRNGPSNWWTKFCDVSEEAGGVSHFRFPAAGFFAKMRTTRREPPSLLEWECIDSRHPTDSGWSDLRDWVGTKIRFEVAEEGEGASRLHFVHAGLIPKLECYGVCRSAWSDYLGDSLRAYLEQGEGKPFADDSVDKIGDVDA